MGHALLGYQEVAAFNAKSEDLTKLLEQMIVNDELSREVNQEGGASSGSDVVNAGIPVEDMVAEFEEQVIGNSGEA